MNAYLENEKNIESKLESIAALLGGELQERERPWFGPACINFPDGKCICLRNKGMKTATLGCGKFEITGDYLRDSSGHWHGPKNPVEITISADKPAEMIAKEIARRFIPKYTAQFEEAKADAEEWNDHFNGINERKKALIARGCIPLYSSTRVTAPNLRGVIIVNSSTYRFEIDVPDDTAEKIFDLLLSE